MRQPTYEVIDAQVCTAIEGYGRTEQSNPNQQICCKLFRPTAGILEDKTRRDLPEHNQNKYAHNQQGCEFNKSIHPGFQSCEHGLLHRFNFICEIGDNGPLKFFQHFHTPLAKGLFVGVVHLQTGSYHRCHTFLGKLAPELTLI